MNDMDALALFLCALNLALALILLAAETADRNHAADDGE
jgi:hypothetical protein